MDPPIFLTVYLPLGKDRLMAKRQEKGAKAASAPPNGSGSGVVRGGRKGPPAEIAAPVEAAPLPAEAAPLPAETAESERAMGVRERALRLLELSLADREDALSGREKAVAVKEHALQEREDDLSIREAALDEAMSLASEMGGVPTPKKRAEPEVLLEGVSDLEVMLEGAPDIPEPVAAPPEPEKPAAPTISPEDDKAAAARRDEELRKIRAESQALMDLVGDQPFLQFVEPRLRRAESDGTLDMASLLGFYGLVARLIKEELDKMRRVLVHAEHEAVESAKAVSVEKAAIISLQEDFDRYRKRTKSEQEGMTVRANEELLRRVIPVADDFKRALKASSGATNVESVLSGVQMISRQFDDILSREGLVPIPASMGTPFDPKVHEALKLVETDEVPEDTICEEMQRGYYLGGKVFRPAMVYVATTKPPSYFIALKDQEES
ncbi:MAG: nucleotide exchange factor GrpE [Armatimonadetes bacterium]|nr:nucleotide exchange factor GrpE [Armatimonadota bacterium]